jgi:hypothetical protein
MSPSRAASKPKPVSVFAAQAALIGAALIFLPGVSGVYPKLFNEHANVVFQWFGAERRLHFKTLPEGSRRDGSDSRMSGYGPHHPKAQWRLIYRIESRGWWPTAILIGMVVATPLPLRRRIGALLAGLVLLDALILARIAATAGVMYGASGPKPDEFFQGILDPVLESFNSWLPPAMSVLLSWVVVCQPARTIDVRAAWIGSLLGRRGRPRSAPAAGEERAEAVAEQGENDRERE